MKSRKLLGLMATLTLSACAGQQTPPELHLDEAENSGIVGGTEVRLDDPIASTVVGLYDTERGAICTGSIISKNLVLTAAHCIVGPPSNYVVIFGANLRLPQERLVIRPVVDFEISPLRERRRNESLDTGDIALVKFSGALPRGYQPAKLLPRADMITDGKRVTLAGYGYTDGIKKTGTETLRKVDVQIKRARFTRTEILIDQTQGRGACQGDSGGPAYINVNGESYVFGVTSRGINDPKNTCGVYSAYTSVPAHMSWLRPAASQLNSRRPPQPVQRSSPAAPRRDARPLAGF